MKTHITLLAFLLTQQFSAQAQTYCTPTGLDCSSGDGPNLFQMTGEQSSAIAYSSSACNTDAYFDHSGTTGAIAYPGNTYSFDVQSGFNDQALSIWIDLNNDGVFQSSERVVTEEVFGSTATTLSMTIPASATPGNYRMRVMGVYDPPPGGGSGELFAPLAATYPMDPCNLDAGGTPVYTYGKTLDFYINVMSDPLPVTLAHFVAVPEGGGVHLQWTTFTESENKGFFVEHSTDGTQWRSIGFVASQADKGSSKEALEYRFVHHTPAKGQNIYRLQQVDRNGTQHYSSVRKVTINGSDLRTAFLAYPNPVSKWLTIEGAEHNEKIRVFSITGSLLIDQKAVSDKVDMSLLANGMYIIQVIDAQGNTREQKVQKMDN